MDLRTSFPTLRRRALMLAALAAGIVLAVWSDFLHDSLLRLLAAGEVLVREHPVLGMAVFVALAAISAMAAFVSSAVITPVGILAWGKAITVLLLWIGWVLGGVIAYTLGRRIGRPVVQALHHGEELERYGTHLNERAPFGFVLLFQFALPSELPGYLLGLARYPLRKYLVILLLAELPYSIATIYLGSSFLDRRASLLIVLGAIAAAASLWALRALRIRWSRLAADNSGNP